MDVSIDRNPEVQTLAVPQGNPKQSKPGNDIALKIEKPPRPQAQVVQPKPQPKPQPPPQLSQPPQQNVQNLQTFEEFANPRKLKPNHETSSIDDDDDDDEENEEEDPSEYSVDEPIEEEEEEDHLKPSPGYHSIDEEKAALIFKVARAKRAGMPSTRNFSMASDIRDLRGELARIEHELALDSSLKFQRKMLMMTVSVMEHMNTRFDPFDLQLNGWSENVHNSISDYDRVFERLHEKYKSKVSMAPEIELLFMVGGSAMMFHFTKTVFKQGLPGMSANPELVASMMKAFTQTQTPAQQQTPVQQAPTQQLDQKPNEPPQKQRREMRGPSMDLGGILGAGGGAMPFPPMPPPKPSKSVSFAPDAKRPRPDEEDERLSDIVSDMDSIPDDLSSFGSDSTHDGEIRTVAVKNKKAKKVITI
jgi:hypothetical protein